jgi:hypothetical protein
LTVMLHLTKAGYWLWKEHVSACGKSMPKLNSVRFRWKLAHLWNRTWQIRRQCLFFVIVSNKRVIPYEMSMPKLCKYCSFLLKIVTLIWSDKANSKVALAWKRSKVREKCTKV